MPLYYFNVINAAGAVLDVEGTDLPDLEAARVEAMKDAQSLMSNAMLEGRDISSRHIEICDEDGKLLLSIAFSDAISKFE